MVGGIPIDLTDATFTVSGTATIQLFGIVTGTVDFAFQQQTINVDVDRNGVLDLPVSGTAWARGPPGPDLTNATLTTLGLSIPSGQPLTIGVGGVAFTVTAGSLALAIVTPSAAAQAGGDSRTWLALDAQITSATFNGIPGLTLDRDRADRRDQPRQRHVRRPERAGRGLHAVARLDEEPRPRQGRHLRRDGRRPAQRADRRR